MSEWLVSESLRTNIQMAFIHLSAQQTFTGHWVRPDLGRDVRDPSTRKTTSLLSWSLHLVGKQTINKEKGKDMMSGEESVMTKKIKQSKEKVIRGGGAIFRILYHPSSGCWLTVWALVCLSYDGGAVGVNGLGGPFLVQCSQVLWLCKAVAGHSMASGNSRLSLSGAGERFAWSEEDQRGLAPFWEREPHAHSLSCSENSDMITCYLLRVRSFWQESSPTQDSRGRPLWS